MVEIRGETYEGWQIEVGVERRASGAFPGQYFIAQQVIRQPNSQARLSVPHDTHVGGPYPSPADAFAKGFSDCRRVINRFIGQSKQDKRI